MIKKILYVLGVLIYFTSCTENNIGDINSLTQVKYVPQEIVEEVEIVYSDSGRVELIVEAPTLIRQGQRSEMIEIFPDGLKVSFVNANKTPTSWLVADYAVRNPKDAMITASRYVKFYNTNGESLETTELTWSPDDEVVETNKFVRLIQPMRGDTSYGYGFSANKDFTRFEIKKHTASRVNISQLLKN